MRPASTYPGDPIQGEDPHTSDVSVAVHWVHEYSRRLHQASATLELVLTQLEERPSEATLIREQTTLLRYLEDLMARLRYWDDREADLRSPDSGG